MTRLVTLALVTLGLLMTPVALVNAESSAAPLLIIDGAGLGHGVGLTQYGAQGQALEGNTAAEIIDHYYSGAEVKALGDQLPADHWMLTDPDPLWVSLIASRSSVDFHAVGGDITICDPECDQIGLVGETWEYETLGDGTCRFVVDETHLEPRECSATVTPGEFGTRVSIPVLSANGGNPRDEMGRGKVQFRSTDGGATFHVLLEISLEDYTRGVREMPFSFHTEALETQALASRTLGAYKALNKCRNGAPDCVEGEPTGKNCYCHLTRDPSTAQVYAGWNVEKIGGDWVESPRWNAVIDATTGSVAAMDGAAGTRNGIIETLFSAASGGATENNEDVWGGSPIPYLRSVPDPWSLDPGSSNPYWHWERSYSEESLVARVAEDAGAAETEITEQGLVEAIESLSGAGDISKVDGMDVVERFDSGRPSRIDIYTRTGTVTDVVSTNTPTLRRALGLPSKFIHGFNYGSLTGVAGSFTADTAEDLAAFLQFNAAWWVDDGTGPLPWANHAHNGDWGSLVVGDFNDDGIDDVAGYRLDKAKWIVGISNGSSFDQDNWGGHKNPETEWVRQLAGDFNGDGVSDIADFKVNGSKWKVLLSRGDTFAPADTWKKHAQGFVWAHQIVGDFDDDGHDDIAQYHTVKGKVVVLYGGDHNYAKETFVEVSPAVGWSQMEAADFNGDGRDDLGLYDPDLGKWWVSLSDSGQRTGSEAVPWHTASSASHPAFQVTGRFDGDQLADIAQFDGDTGIWMLLSSSGAAFDSTTWADTEDLAGTLTSAVVLDIDGDGDSDIASLDEDKRIWWVAIAASSAFNVTVGSEVLAN